MDNSPRFDHGVSDMLAVDFSVFLAREAKLLAEIATEVGNATAAAHWATVAKNAAYLRYGVIFEFYDADGKADPRTLMRKGEPTGGVRDYHWSAALAYDAIMRLAR